MTNHLTTRVNKCVDEAYLDLQEGSLSILETKVWGFSSNRSLSAHKRNPDHKDWLTDPALPGHGGLDKKGGLNEEDLHIDPRLRAFVVADSRGDTSGVIGAFSCHNTTMGPSCDHYDPDWAGAAKVAAKEAMGLEVPVSVMQACCGDICPMPISGPFGAKNERGARPIVQGDVLKDCVGGGIGGALGSLVASGRKLPEGCSETSSETPSSSSKKRKKGATTTAAALPVKKTKANPFVVSGATESWFVSQDFDLSDPMALSPAEFGVATIAGTASGGNPALYKHLGMGYPSNTLPDSHPQHPKTPLPFPASKYVPWAAPKILPLTVTLLCGSVCIATVPGEPTIMAGAQIENAIKAR